MSIKTRDKNQKENGVANGHLNGQEGGVSLMPPAQLFSSSNKEEEKKEVAPSNQNKQADSGGKTDIPENVKAKMENSLGHDFSNVRVHENSSTATEMGALAYAQGNEVHFAPGQFNPETESGQKLIGHELAHVVQQREGKVAPTTKLGTGVDVNDDPGLEKEADKLGDKAAMGGEVSEKSSATSVSGSNVVQGFFDYKYTVSGETWRQADDMSLAVKVGYPNHELYAKKGKVAEANKKLDAVGSGVELQETSTSSTFKKGSYLWASKTEELNKVEVKNKTNATEGDNMELWADCGKSNGVVVGSDSREAVYNDPSGLEAKAAGSPAAMKSKIMKEWLTDKHASASGTEQKAMSGVISKAKSYEAVLPKLVDDYNKAKTEAEKKTIARKYGSYVNKIAEVYWEYYNTLSKTEQDNIDKKIGINKYANPEVGQGYTTSSGGTPVKGFESNTWNFHWGGVVLESDDKSDKVVLENYAVGDASVENKDWEFAMYGTKKEDQSFHEVHKGTNQHGESPTTMTIEKK